MDGINGCNQCTLYWTCKYMDGVLIVNTVTSDKQSKEAGSRD